MVLKRSFVTRFFGLPSNQRRLFFEALRYSLVAKCMIWFVPFKKFAPKLGERRMSGTTAVSASGKIMLPEIRRSIRRVTKYSPWKTKCFVEAITAARMLQKRRIPYTLHLGVSKDTKNGLIAHAWLVAGKWIVTGERGMKKFTSVEKFTYIPGE